MLNWLKSLFTRPNIIRVRDPLDDGKEDAAFPQEFAKRVVKAREAGWLENKMTETRDEYKKRIIARAESEGDIFPLEDGFYYFGPSTGGAMSAELLRVIADELDRRNEGWAAKIEEYFATNQPPAAPQCL